MKKVFSIVLFLSAFFHCMESSAKLETVTVGTGTNTSYDVPFGCYYCNATCQFILTSAELNAKSGVISAIAFNVAQANSYSTNDVVVYLGTTSMSTYASASDYINPSKMTRVYSGNPTLGKTTGWEKINFNTPFDYDGKSNLVVTIGRKSSSWTNNLLYNTSNVSKACLLRQNDNNTDYGDPTQTAPAFSLKTTRPNVQVVFGTQTKKTINGVTYIVEGDEAIVVGCDKEIKGDLVLESSISDSDGTYPVTQILEGVFKDCTSLSGITIPGTVNTISNDAFSGCTSLKKVVLNPGTGTLAFGHSGSSPYYYYALFRNCPLETVVLDRNISFAPSPYSYSGSPFDGIISLTLVSVGKNVTTIPDDTFNGCRSISMVFNNSNMDIQPGSRDYGKLAYYVNFVGRGELVDNVGDFLCYKDADKYYIYGYVGSDTEIAIPAGFNLAPYAFYEKSDITSVTFMSGSILSPHTFQKCSSLTTVNLPSDLKEIPDFAFGDCKALASIDIPKSVVRIGNGAFLNCVSLESVDIPDGLTDLGAYSFKNCETLTSVKIPAGITSIGDHTFFYCSKLKDVELPANLTSIGGFAFYYASVGDFEWPTSLESIGTYAFCANELTELNLPNSVKSIGRGAFCWCDKAVTLTVPEGIEEISDDAFRYCQKLKTVTLPSSLTTIAKRAFANCPIRNINWPDNLTTLGYKAFSGSPSIYSPIIPKNVNNAGRILFYGNNDLSSVYCYSETVMPDNTFLASDMKESTLYVKPNVLEKFKASSLASIFKQILPLGDANGDGDFTIADVVTMISLMKKSPAAMEAEKPGASDINGDGIIGVDDVEQMKEYIIKK